MYKSITRITKYEYTKAKRQQNWSQIDKRDSEILSDSLKLKARLIINFML